MQSEEAILAVAKALVENPPEERYEQRDGEMILVREYRRSAIAALEAALSTAEPSEPKAYMHPCGAIWRADNYPAGMDFTADGWVALYDTPAPFVTVKALDWHRRITSWGHLLVAYDPFSRQAYTIRVEDNTTEENISRAKAEKQADYEARIRSTLTAQVQDVAVPSTDMRALQSWVYQQRVSLQTNDPEYFAKYGVWKAVGAQIRSMLPAAPAKQEGKP